MNVIKKRSGQFIAIIVALLMCIATVAQAVPQEQNVAPPGDPEFVALSQYATPVEGEPGLFKVMLNIEPPSISNPIPPVYVAIALDPSTSMTLVDIWDSNGEYARNGIARWIDRYQAIELAVEEFIDELVASGNPEIYVSLRGHTRNSVVVSSPGLTGYEKIYDAGGNLKDKFKRTDPTWIMRNWGAAANPALWGNSSDNDVGIALQRVHADLKASIVSGGIPANAARYVLVMGDGADTSGALVTPQINTQRIAMAVKAPLDPNYLAGNPTAATAVAGLPTATYGGLDATIWTVSVGPDINHNPNWAADYLNPNYAVLWNFSTILGAGRSPSLILGGTWGNQAEYWLIADSAELNSYPTTHLGDAALAKDYLDYYIANLGPVINNPSDPHNSNVHYYHSVVTRTDPPPAMIGPLPYVGNNTSFDRTNWRPNSDPLLDVFGNFAQAATGGGGGDNIKVAAGIKSTFKIEKVPGHNLIDFVTTDTDPSIVFSVKQVGNGVEWEINKMNGGEKYTIIYYVRYVGADFDPDLWYEINDHVYIDYINSKSDRVVKHFPSTIVKMDPLKQEEVKLNKPEATPGTPANVERIDVVPIGTLMPAYTPSAPNKPVKVKDEEVSEGSVEMPLTGQITYAVLGVCTILGVLTFIVIKKRKNHK